MDEVFGFPQVDISGFKGYIQVPMVMKVNLYP